MDPLAFRIIFAWLLALSMANCMFLGSAKPVGDHDSAKQGPTTSTQRSVQKPGKEVFIGVVSTEGLVMVIALLMALIFCLKSCRVYKIYNSPSQHFVDMLQDKIHTLDISTLKEQCMTVLNWRPRDGEEPKAEEAPEVKLFLAGIVDKAAEDAEKAAGKLEMVKGAREDTLPIRQETRVKVEGALNNNLHVSKLSDFYGNPAYLCQSPMPTQFVDQWKFLWQEKIGVIVWIGRLVLDEKVRIHSYIDAKDSGTSVSHGEFQIVTKRKVEKYSRYNQYHLEVSFRGQKRDIVLFHAYEWLQDSVSWALQRDVLTLLMVKREHCQQLVKGLPGILFQCKLGTAGSATMLAVYIGYQMWLRHRKVNMYGILKYIRRQRYGAFEMTGDKGHTFLLQVQVAYTVMTEMAKFGNGDSIPMFEPWVREIWCAEQPLPIAAVGKSQTASLPVKGPSAKDPKG